jgi:hypothetical protein
MKIHFAFRPGAWWLKFRQTYGKGLTVARYRDRVRPRILQSSPCVGLTDSSAEVHVLTSSQDWLNLMWTLKSFYRVCGKPYRLVIHEDGSLGEEALGHIRRLFPDARLIARDNADTRVLASLADYPHSHEFRKTNALSLKVFDFRHFLDADRMILLDSDVLFYRRPDVLMNRIEDAAYDNNTVNGDVASVFTVESDLVRERFGFALPERFNSGLGLIHRDSLSVDWIEELLQLPGIIGHFWRIEQTLYALCSGRFGVELLPPEYDVYLDKGIGERPSRHYVGAIRHLMYSEGMARLVKETDILS